MKSLLFVLSQLLLVTLVYAFAYRAGYRSAQSRAMSVVRKFADPVTCLLDELRNSVDEERADELPPSNPPEADRHRRSTSKEEDLEV